MNNKIGHSIKIFIKNFAKNRVPNSLSIIGLSIGISVATLIGWWCFNEFSYDSFHKDAESIHLVCGKGMMNGESVEMTQTFGPIANIAKSTYSEVEDAVRVAKRPDQILSIKSVESTDDIVIVDPNFFSFFTFSLLSGDTNTCLLKPESIVVTESFLKQYSLGKDPIGTVVNYMNKAWTITAIMRDIPQNSHIEFDALVSMKGVPEMDITEWQNTSDQYITYLKTQVETDIDELSNKITQVTLENMPPLKQMEFEYRLIPLEDIYFKTNGFRFSQLKSSDIKIVMILLFMAIAILITAAINFTNLFVSTTYLRVKSMAIRRANGAGRGIVIRDIFIESSLYITIALLISIIITSISHPIFNDLFKSELLFEVTDYRFIIFIIAIGSITTIISAIYPAISFANMDITQALKGGDGIRKKDTIPKILIVIQLVSTIIFIIAVSMVKRQVNFLITRDRGFNTENTIYFNTNARSFTKNYNTIKEELERVPNITGVTAASTLPTLWNRGTQVNVPGKPITIMEITSIKYNYPEQMSIEVIQGDKVSEIDNGSNMVWINETAAKVLQFDNPIGQEIKMGGMGTRRIKGIFKDYNAKSMHSVIDPMIFIPFDPTFFFGNPAIFIKFSGDSKDIITSIEEIWKKYNVKGEFDYGFLDEEYEKLYQKEAILGEIVSWGMGIALLITLFGLFAVSKFSAERRTKEIGIHIINGASTYSIISKLSSEFIKLALLASIIGVPIGYYISDKWLENFVNKANISWWILVVPILITSTITTLTVAYHARKVANIDPVKTLRNE